MEPTNCKNRGVSQGRALPRVLPFISELPWLPSPVLPFPRGLAKNQGAERSPPAQCTSPHAVGGAAARLLASSSRRSVKGRTETKPNTHQNRSQPPPPHRPHGSSFPPRDRLPLEAEDSGKSPFPYSLPFLLPETVRALTGETARLEKSQLPSKSHRPFD